jgi:mannosyl-oligosaccharide glucosidase
MDGYGWTNYDIRTGGSQTVEDTKGNLKLTTELLKIPGGPNGGNWGLRIRGIPLTESQNLQTLAVFYIASENDLDMHETNLECINTRNQNRSGETIEFSGSAPSLGSFKLLLQPPSSSTSILHTN